jgi:transposase-like protein
MAHSVFDQPQFLDEAAAFAYVEAQLWPEGPVCPHCGAFGDDVGKLNGKTTRLGLHKCYQCSGHFTVRQGSIFESSHLPLHLWLQVIHLMCASKKGISTRQVQRMLRCSMKTAWHLTHRIREAMREGEFFPFGSGGATVEVDETFLHRDPENQRPDGRQTIATKMTVVSLIERETGRARSFVAERYDLASILPIVTANLSREAKLRTDDSVMYRSFAWRIQEGGHQSVNHSAGEYVRRDDPTIHTNTVEGFFNVFKRGMIGVYQHCDKRHLHRYLAEFDFRYSNRSALGVEDIERADAAIRGAKGRRLTYQTIGRGRASRGDGAQA